MARAISLALERGERIERPPAPYIQGDNGVVHPRADLDRLVAGYRKADGRVELELIEGEGEAFIARKSASLSAARPIARIIEFVQASMA
jgi:acetyl esterase